MFKWKSLSSKMIVSLITGLTIVMFMVGIPMYLVNKIQTQSKVASASEQIAKRLAFSLTMPVWNMKMNEIETILNLEMENKMLEGIILKDNNSKLISAVTRVKNDSLKTSDQQSIDAMQKMPKLTLFEKKVINEKDTIGIVALYVTDLEVKRSMNDILKMIIILLVTSALFIAIIVYNSLKKLVIKPMRQLLSILGAIEGGKGDLTSRIVVNSKDEFEELARLFNSFVDNIQKIMRDVIGNANTLTESSVSLLKTAEHFATSASRMQEESISVASSAKTTSERLDLISVGSKEMSGEIHSVATAIEEISVSINEVAKSCQKESLIATAANSQAHSTQDVMVQLGKSAEHIGNVVNVIKRIADKTNLLSLNATIQAASAGDAGKGFSVVAAEVKELAMQTALATNDISSQIFDMQKNVAHSIKVINEIGDTIENVNTISQTIVSAVEEQSSTINEVAKSISIVSTSSGIIASNVSQTAVGISQVSGGINKVSTDVESNMAYVQSIKTSSEVLSKLAAEMHTLVGQFKI